MDELKKLANTTLKDRSGAAVSTPEFERLKKEAENSRFAGPKRREELKNALKKTKKDLETYASKSDSLKETSGAAVSEEEMGRLKEVMPKKAKGGEIVMGKGADYIKDLL
jgi:hypothetical protein